jgi:hypothetical protein
MSHFGEQVVIAAKLPAPATVSYYYCYCSCCLLLLPLLQATAYYLLSHIKVFSTFLKQK